jgi:large subunit ribosomal protein L15
MIVLSNLKPAVGSKHRRKIVGRGVGSGHGRTSTRGSKGQRSRSGDGAKKIGFEGGQMPLYRRIPKRGFTNKMFSKEYEIVNIETLNKFDNGTQINPAMLKEKGFVAHTKLVKILGNGKLEKSLALKGFAFSKSAKEKVEAAGGTIE